MRAMKKYFLPAAWGLSILTATLAVITWIQCLEVPFGKMEIYDIFPVFGLVAFSLMWSHYIVGAGRLYYGIKRDQVAQYFTTTASVVLVAILFHPGLLIWQMWRDQAGLPVNYVAPDHRLYVVMAEVAWLAFLSFELHRFYKDKSWWHWVERASDVAMYFILIHAYQLGCSLLPGWYQFVWFFYGITLTAAIAYTTNHRHKTTGHWL